MNSYSYQPEPEFLKTNPVSYQPEPEFRQITGIPVLNPVPVVPYRHGFRKVAMDIVVVGKSHIRVKPNYS